MSIVNTFSLQSNRQIKINFDGGDLSSDAGLLLIKEFISKLGIERLLNRSFKTNISLAGNLDYEKKIETSAINCMHLQTTRVREALLEKIKNSTTDVINGVLNSYELSKVLEKLQKDIWDNRGNLKSEEKN